MSLFFFNNERITALTLANYILKKAQEQGISVTNSKLQKILYYVQGYYMARFNHPLFPDEIQAWKFGPVVPNVYYAFSYCGPDTLQMLEEPDMDNCSKADMKVINRIIDEKLLLSATALIDATRNEAPWLEATDGGNVIRPGLAIKQESIMDFFQGTDGAMLNKKRMVKKGGNTYDSR